MVQNALEEEESYINQIRVIFQRSDLDHSGNMTEKELEYLLTQDDFKNELERLGIHPTEAHGLFKLLDGVSHPHPAPAPKSNVMVWAEITEQNGVFIKSGLGVMFSLRILHGLSTAKGSEQYL